MAGPSSLEDFVPMAFVGTMFGALVLGSAIAGCVDKNATKAQKPLEETVTLEGIPSMPSASIGYMAITHLSFVLNCEGGKEYLCTYDGGGSTRGEEMLNASTAAIIDASEDKQTLLVKGKLDGKKFEIYNVTHPDFGTYQLR